MLMVPRGFGESLLDDLMDSPFDRAFSMFRNSDAGKRERGLMRTDIKERDGNYELDMDLPGYNKEDVKIKLEDGYLTVRASHGESREEKDDNGNYIRQERYRGECSRSFYVGEGLDSGDLKAKFENGILHVVFPKDKPKQIEDKKYIEIE